MIIVLHLHEHAGVFPGHGQHLADVHALFPAHLHQHLPEHVITDRADQRHRHIQPLQVVQNVPGHPAGPGEDLRRVVGLFPDRQKTASVNINIGGTDADCIRSAHLLCLLR